MKKIILLILVLGISLTSGFAQYDPTINNFFSAAGSPANPKVDASWNKYRNLAQIEALCKEIANAYPNLVKTYSIGKSFEGNEMWGMTISDFKSGDPDKKPAMIIFANIHSNEIQATTMALYTAWYLTEMHGDNAFIQELLRDKTFYILPTINPDAREYYMTDANTSSSPRAGMIPVDSDRDGYIDEDLYDDLNKDGHISSMRRKNPNGLYVQDPEYPTKMVRVKPGQKGEYDLLGSEGIDNDGDGRVNEDGVGGYDPNRDWGYGWEPNFIQRGTLKYPFTAIENRNVAEFALKHPNIAAGQTYHNSGGMILAPPGGVMDAQNISSRDRAVYDAIALKGEELIPGYRAMITYKDLYTTMGSDIDFFNMGLGVFLYCNELYSTFDLFNGKYKGDPMYQRDEFNKLLLFDDTNIPWKEVDHPFYGKIEVGGTTKNASRIHPGFLLESAAHRNMAHTIYHGYHTPKLSIDLVEEKELGNNLVEITATISNSRIIPTHNDWDLRNNISRPDWVSIDGADVIAGMIVTNPMLSQTQEQKNNPEKLLVRNIPGNSSVSVRWIVKKSSKYTISVNSLKGGLATYKK